MKELMFPTEQIVFHGQTVNMYCISQYNVEWEMPHYRTKSLKSTLLVRLVQGKLVTARTIRNVGESQEGFYSCQGIYDDYNFFSYTSFYVVSKLQEYL